MEDKMKETAGSVQLTEMQKRFVEILGGMSAPNAGEAALQAGFAGRTYGYRLMTVGHIRREVERRQKKTITAQAQAAGITRERVLAEEQALAYADLGEIIDPETGKPRSVNEIPEHVRRAIKSIKIKIAKDGSQTWSYRLWNKGQALERLSRHLGLYDKDNQQKTKPVLLQVNIGRTLKKKETPAVDGRNSS